MNDELPWIQVGSPSYAPEGEYHALFATYISPRPFASRQEAQWGFNAQALLTEALGRQLEFLAAQHPPFGTQQAPAMLALRCLIHPGDPSLHLLLLVKVSASSPQQARALAGDRWHALRALVPYDYELHPLKTAASFHALSGAEWLEGKNVRRGLVSIRRYEGSLRTENGTFYLRGRWQSTERTNEQLWRALAESAGPLFYNVMLLPIMFEEGELYALEEACQGLEEVAAENPNHWMREEAQRAAANYRHYATNYQKLFFIQVHLAASQPLPPFLMQAAGASLAGDTKSGGMRTHYMLQNPPNDEWLEHWVCHLRWLDLIGDDESLTDRRFSRLRHAADLAEAHAAFRLPFPPKKGIPGVQFATGDYQD